MKKTVLKFGGTSLDTKIKRDAVCNIIKTKLENDEFPVVVVSAMGREKQPYSTDSLKNLINTGYTEIQSFICSCGEMISAAVIASMLKETGLKAKPLTGWQAGIITKRSSGKNIISSVFSDRVQNLINSEIIPVICGFQGISQSGEITTLSRGGTDISAAYISKSVNADSLEVYKDVEGIFSADPGKVAKARLLQTVSYEELAEITGNGSGVIHNHAVEYAAAHNIPIGVGDTISEKIGTVISSQKSLRIISAVSSKPHLSLVSINNKGNSLVRIVFNQLSENNISADFISVSKDSICFVVDEGKKKELETCLNGITHNIEEGFCKISLCGNGMTGQPGVMAKVTDSIIRNNIDIILATDSYSTISVLIKNELEEKVLNILHQEFILQEED